MSKNKGNGIASECKYIECSVKPKKFGFCLEHFPLFKAGVIRADGLKPVDFEDKLSHFLAQEKEAA